MTVKDAKDIALALSIGLMFTGLGELEVAVRALTYGNVASGIGQSFTGIRDLFSSNVHTRDLGGITLALGATDILFGRIESKQLPSSPKLNFGAERRSSIGVLQSNHRLGGTNSIYWYQTVSNWIKEFNS